MTPVGRASHHAGRRPRRVVALFALCVVGVVATGCAPASGSGGSTTAGVKTGSVDVLYAGSLVTLMQTSVDPGFHRATGYTVTGIAAGSTALASEIKGGVHVADVLVSASTKGDTALEGAANGSWVRWYATFATSPLVLGYDPSSRFAATLRSEPWWKVVTKPGFQLGRTNPATDPKGVLIVKAVDQAAEKEHDPALRSTVSTSSNVFPEQTLVGRLQAGQLDAGFFYGVEAAAAKLATVPLQGVGLGADFTITIVSRAPHPAAADAFVGYLLGAEGRALMRGNGMTELAKPQVRGQVSAVPADLRKVLEK